MQMLQQRQRAESLDAVRQARPASISQVNNVLLPRSRNSINNSVTSILTTQLSNSGRY